MTRTVRILCHGRPVTATRRNVTTGRNDYPGGPLRRTRTWEHRYVCDHCGQEVKVAA